MVVVGADQIGASFRSPIQTTVSIGRKTFRLYVEFLKDNRVGIRGQGHSFSNDDETVSFEHWNNEWGVKSVH